MPAKKKPGRIHVKRGAAKKTKAEDSLERRMEDFGKEVGQLGEHFGKRMERFGREMEHHGRKADSWGMRTFGPAGPFLSSVFGTLMLSLCVLLLSLLGTAVGSGFLYSVHTFLLANMGVFFLFFLFFSYSSYFSKASPRAFSPFSPIFKAIGAVIGFWLFAQALKLANISMGLDALHTLSLLVEVNLLTIFWIVALVGYLILLLRLAGGTCPWCAPQSRREADRQKRVAAAYRKGGMKRLYRSGRDRILGGVCGGIAEYLGIDPVIVRLIWVLLSLTYGFGILLYVIMWIIIPRNPEHVWK
jgi:phage shock protein C